jgi:NAD(P)-dependent dehydrogenase (short-subunit alcohol dehydrogenase family)
MKRFDDKAAIVTGSASGIGQAIALRLAEENCRVLAIDKSDDGLKKIAAIANITTLTVDVTARTAAPKIIEECLRLFGKLDVLVNTVGLGGGPVRIDEATDDDLDNWIDVNLKPTLRFSRDALPALRMSRGVILNISSVAGLVGLSQPIYAAAKAGVIGLTRQMASDYGPAGIRVNAIAPGIIATPALRDRLEARAPTMMKTLNMTPLGRAGEPWEVAAAAAFLCSADANYVTGHTLCVDGGLTATRFLSEEVLDTRKRTI